MTTALVLMLATSMAVNAIFVPYLARRIAIQQKEACRLLLENGALEILLKSLGVHAQIEVVDPSELPPSLDRDTVEQWLER